MKVRQGRSADRQAECQKMRKRMVGRRRNLSVVACSVSVNRKKDSEGCAHGMAGTFCMHLTESLAQIRLLQSATRRGLPQQGI